MLAGAFKHFWLQHRKSKNENLCSGFPRLQATADCRSLRRNQQGTASAWNWCAWRDQFFQKACHRPGLCCTPKGFFWLYCSSLLIAFTDVFGKQKYKACFSNSTACRAPNVNLSVLRNALFRSKVLESRPISTSDDLVALLEDINTQLMNRPQESWPLISKARSLSKARSGIVWLECADDCTAYVWSWWPFLFMSTFLRFDHRWWLC